MTDNTKSFEFGPVMFDGETPVMVVIDLENYGPTAQGIRLKLRRADASRSGGWHILRISRYDLFVHPGLRSGFVRGDLGIDADPDLKDKFTLKRGDE